MTTEHQDHHDAYEHDHHEMVFLNHKRTYDEYQDIALTAARRSQEHHDELSKQALRHAEELHQVALANMQNANISHDMAAKQALRHGDLAVDRQWNFDFVSSRASSVGNTQAAIDAAVAAHVVDMHGAK